MIWLHCSLFRNDRTLAHRRGAGLWSFAFAGIDEKSPYLYAIITVRIGQETDDRLGYMNMRLSVPIANRDRSLAALREESLALARETIQTAPLLAWMTAQRAAGQTQAGQGLGT